MAIDGIDMIQSSCWCQQLEILNFYRPICFQKYETLIFESNYNLKAFAYTKYTEPYGSLQGHNY